MTILLDNLALHITVKGAGKMIHLETDIEGKQMYFGEAQKELGSFGISMGGNWDYDRGIFDGIMHREGGETIYIRLPFQVIDGELDRRDAFIEFQKPFIRSEEHTSELQSRGHLVCRLLLEKKK